MVQRTVSVGLVANVSNYVANMNRAAEATRKTAAAAVGSEKQLRAQGELYGKIGTTAMAGGALAAAGLAVVIKATADYGSKMAQLQSLSKASRSEMAQLSKAAMEQGKAYGYSASQVADAEIELTKAGLSTKEILGGGLKSALSLAAAGQLDVGKATEISTIAMTDFKLKASDLPHVADLLAAGADKALGSVGDLGEGLANGGQQAHNMGLSIQDTVGTLSAFANAGIIGAEGGTQLRSMFIQLQHVTPQAQKVLDQYGISIYDTSGKFVGMTKLAGELSDKLGHYSQAQKNAALATIFGSHAITGASVLMGLGAKGMQAWITKVNEYGFANAQAAGKMNSLSGDVQKLSASFDTNLIKAGSGANSQLRGLVQTADNLVNAFGDLPPWLTSAGVGLTAAGATVAIVGGAALVAVPKIALFRRELAEAGTTGRGVAKTFGKGGALALGLGATVAAVSNLGLEGDASKQQLAAAAQQISSSWGKVNTLFNNAGWGKGNDFLAGLKQVSGQAVNGKQALDQLAGGGTAQLGRLGAQAVDAATGFLTFGAAGTHLSDVTKSNTQTFDAFGQQLSGLAQQSLPAAQKSFAQLNRQFGGGQDNARELLSVMKPYKDTLTDLASKAGVTASDANLLSIAQGKGAASAKVLAYQQKKAAASAKQQSDALQTLAGSADAGATSVSALKNAIDGLDGGQVSASEAAISMQQAIEAAAVAAKKGARGLDISTKAGQENQHALNDVVSTTEAAAKGFLDAGGSAAGASKIVRSGRKAWIDQAAAMLGSRAAAVKLAAAYFNIPKTVKTTVTLVDGTKAVLDPLEARLAALAKRRYTTYVDVITKGGSVGQAASAAGFGAGNASGTKKTHKAGGGSIDGPGPKGVDSVEAVLAPGEHVLTADDVDAMGGQGEVYAFRGRLHMAAGGAVAKASSRTAKKGAPVKQGKSAVGSAAKKKIAAAQKSAIDEATDAINSAASDKSTFTTQLSKAKKKLATDTKKANAADKAYKKAQDDAAAIHGKGTAAAKHAAEMRVRDLKKRDDAAKKKVSDQQKTIDGISKKLDTATQKVTDQTERRIQLRNDAEDFQSTQRRATADNPIDPMSYVDQLRAMSRDDNYSVANRHTFDDAANKYEASLASLADQSDKAAKKLSDVKDASTQLASSVTSSISGRYASSNAITTQSTASTVVRNGISFSTKSSALTAASLDSYWKTASIDTATFASQLDRLAKRGVDARLLAEIAQDANGPQLAAALLAADATQLASINSNYAATQTNATTAGQTVADANYADLITQDQASADQITAEISADGEKLRKLIASAFGLKGYATGTPSATPGFHPVAENGMELVTGSGVRLFRGGERVYNRAQTESYIRGGGSAAAAVRAHGTRTVVNMPSTLTVRDAQGFEMRMQVIADQRIAADQIGDTTLEWGGAA